MICDFFQSLIDRRFVQGRSVDYYMFVRLKESGGGLIRFVPQ